MSTKDLNIEEHEVENEKSHSLLHYSAKIPVSAGPISPKLPAILKPARF